MNFLYAVASNLTIVYSIVMFGEYSRMLNNGYKQFKIDHPSTDKEAYALACKPILDYCQTLDKPDIPDDNGVAAYMRAYKKQFTNLVCVLFYRVNHIPILFMQAASLWNLHQILVVGAMAYVGDDVVGRQSATIFGGNDSIKGFIEENKMDVKKWLGHLVTVAE